MVGGVHGRVHVWQGGMHGRGHAWHEGMHGGGACMAGGCAWQGGMHDRVCAWQERWPLQRTVRILLKCIVVNKYFLQRMLFIYWL